MCPLWWEAYPRVVVVIKASQWENSNLMSSEIDRMRHQSMLIIVHLQKPLCGVPAGSQQGDMRMWIPTIPAKKQKDSQSVQSHKKGLDMKDFGCT